MILQLLYNVREYYTIVLNKIFNNVQALIHIFYYVAFYIENRCIILKVNIIYPTSTELNAFNERVSQFKAVLIVETIENLDISEYNKKRVFEIVLQEIQDNKNKSTTKNIGKRL